MTQATLAEKLGISDRAVSKWENGWTMPDSSLIQELCSLLKINVNELLSGEKIMSENYDKKAEENLVALKRNLEEKNKQLLRTEYLMGIPSVSACLLLYFLACYFELPSALKICLIAVSTLLIIVYAFIAVGIEQKAGYYECQKCHHKHIPSYWHTTLAPHIGRTRYMKCPKCGKKSWQKKVLTAR